MDYFFKIASSKFAQIFGKPENPSWLIKKELLTEKENPQILTVIFYLYSTKHTLNDWYQSPILLEAAAVVISSFEAKLKEKSFPRRWLPVLADVHKYICIFLPKQEKAFEAYLKAMAKHLAKEIHDKKDLTQLTSANLGYGTNHLAVELKGVVKYEKYCSQKLGRLKGISKPFLKQYLQNFMNYMDPRGFWIECDGPALLYNTLTATSLLSAAYELGELEKYKEQFKVVSDFCAATILPTGRYIDCVDGRNINRTHISHGSFLVFTSSGLAVYHTMLKIIAQTILSTEKFGEGLNHLFFDETMREKYGVTQAKSNWSNRNSQHDFEDFLIVKNQNWIAGVSNIKFRPRPEGHFTIDYQNLLTLYHSAFGEIFGGQNSKNDMEIATFSKYMNTFDGGPVEKPMPKYIPGNGYYIYKNSNLFLTRDYRGFEGLFNIEFKTKDKLEITIQARARANEYPINCNLILPCSIVQPFLNSKKQEVKLTKKTVVFKQSQVGQYIYFKERTRPHQLALNQNRLLKMSFPKEAKIIWPFIPFDTYNLETERMLDPIDWYVVLVIEVTNKPIKLQLDVL